MPKTKKAIVIAPPVIEDITISHGFRGNASLKRAGEPVEWTEERQAEYIRCSMDPLYFAETYMKIVNVDAGLVPFLMYDYQKIMLKSMAFNRNTIITTARQIGKALSLDTKLPTPTGWTTIRDVTEGDFVIGRDGKPTKVVATSEVFTDRDCYRITFDNGAYVDCDSQHQWTVFNTINHDKIETKTTDQLFTDFLGNSNKQGYQQSRYRLPAIDPIEYNNDFVPRLDPYTLGAWLGDGHSAQGAFTCHRDDLDHFKANIPFVFGDARPSCKPNIFTGSIYKIAPLLRSIGVLGNKHIPISYLLGSVEARFKLLQGLMDTDGWVLSKSTAAIQLSRRYQQLIDDVHALLNGLGFKVSVTEFKSTNSIRLAFNVQNSQQRVSRLDRKGFEYSHKKNGSSLLIRNIEQISTVPTKCISVDNDDHLFLCTENLIPTHNSTVTCAFILWYVLFQDSKTVALLANKGDTAREIMGKVSLAYTHLPKWLQQGVLEANKGSLVLENGSRVIATSTSGSAIRGYSINLIFIDECAFIEDWETFFTAVAPTISSGKTTKMILVSTPNGLNHYHKLWVNAINGRSDYHPIKVTWREVPGRDEEWRKKTLSDLNFDMDKFNQENEAEFLGSSGTLISGSVLSSLVHQPTIYESDGLRQYYKPEPGHLYCMVADVSKGVGLDYQACSVMDVSRMPYQQVATYYNNNTLAGDYAQILFNVAKIYNNATILVEINSPAGEQVSNLLIEEHEYDGVLFTENAGRAGKRISMGGMGTKNGIDKGVNTNKAVKQSGCSILKALVENRQLIVNDYDSISELSTFTRKGGSYEAESGKHDDLTMTLVLFSWLTDQRFFKEMTDINTLNKLRKDDEEDIDNRMVGFGLLIDRGGDEDGIMPSDIWHSDKFESDRRLDEQYNALFS